MYSHLKQGRIMHRKLKCQSVCSFIEEKSIIEIKNCGYDFDACDGGQNARLVLTLKPVVKRIKVRPVWMLDSIEIYGDPDVPVEDKKFMTHVNLLWLFYGENV